MAIREVKAGVIGQDAANAFGSGAKYYTPVLNVPMFSTGFSGNIKDWSPMLEAIEAAGWRLHTWALVSDKNDKPQAMPLFVRG
jgi:hypothetical protein